MRMTVGELEASLRADVATATRTSVSRSDRLARNETLAYAIFAFSAIVLGVAVRALPVLGTDFPLSDGGLFYVMVRDLAAHSLALPAYTTYNGGHIPFAYPPLGLYAAVLLHQATGMSLFTVMRFLPLAVSCLSLVAFALLARDMLPMQAAIASVFAFSLVPDSFDMEIKGGGLTRAPGELFAILAVWQLSRLYRSGGWRHVAFAVLYGALTLMSHLEWAEFVFLTAVVCFIALDRSRAGLWNGLIVGVGVLVLSSPWWITVVARHGFAPFAAALVSNSQVFPFQDSIRTALTLSLTHEEWFPIAGVLAILGLVWSVGRRDWMLPAWLGLVILADSRGWRIAMAVPVALLAGMGLCNVILPLLARVVDGNARVVSSRQGAMKIAAAFAVLFLLSRSLLGGLAYEAADNSGLSRGERTAMHWVHGHTPAHSRFLVFGAPRGSTPEDVEWFPALTGRLSMETVQGQEWIPGSYASRFSQVQEIQACGARLSCVLRVIHHAGVSLDYVYLGRASSHARCVALCASIAHDPNYRTAYAGPGAWVFMKSI